MTDESRPTWPAPPAGMTIDELSFKQTIVLLHQKLDVMGRELMQVRKQIKVIEAQLAVTMNEVRRHGQCLAPVSLIPAEGLAHD